MPTKTSWAVVGKTIGTETAIFPMAIMASFAFSRLGRRNLVWLDPGVVEAARVAMGASRWRIIWSVLIPEALGAAYLAFTFLVIGVIDMSAMAGIVGGGGPADFAIRERLPAVQLGSHHGRRRRHHDHGPGGADPRERPVPTGAAPLSRAAPPADDAAPA